MGAEAGRQLAMWDSLDIMGSEKGSQTITFRRLSHIGTQGCYTFGLPDSSFQSVGFPEG